MTLPLRLLLLCLAICLPGRAQDPLVLRYAGHLRVHGAPFTGLGHFVFALENTRGEIFWSSGAFPYQGSVSNPAGALQVPVQAGNYSARLVLSGGTPSAVTTAEFRRLEQPRLRIWFNDGTNGWGRAGEDVALNGVIASLEEADRRPMTTAQGDALLQELRSLRGVLLPPVQAAPAPAPAPPALATVTLSGPALGRTNAPLVLVEFTDFQCPFCKRFHDEVFPQLVRKYVESGQLRIFSRSLPLPFHPNAEPAARAALCAGEQDKYWAMREKLFATSEDLAATNIVRAAAGAGLELAKFQSCWAGKLFEAAVKNDAKEAGSVGITGTPSFVLGKPQGDKLTGVIIVGAQALPVFEAQIAELLPAPK